MIRFLKTFAVECALVVLFAAFLLVLLSVACRSAEAQCGPGGCRVPFAVAPMHTPAPVYRAPVPCDAQVSRTAALNPRLGPEPFGAAPAGDGWEWAELPGIGWGWVQRLKPSECPRPGCQCGPCDCGPGCACGPVVGAAPIPSGIDRSKCPEPTRDYYDVSGRVSTYDGAARLFGEDLADDSAKPWLVCKLDQATRDRLAKDAADDFALQPHAARCRLLLQPTDSKILADHAGAGVWLQAVNGRKLLKLDGYPGAQQLGELLKVKLDQYDPAKDPGEGKPYPWPVTPPPADPDDKKPTDPTEPKPAPCQRPAWVWLVAGLVFGILAYLRRK